METQWKNSASKEDNDEVTTLLINTYEINFKIDSYSKEQQWIEQAAADGQNAVQLHKSTKWVRGVKHSK